MAQSRTSGREAAGKHSPRGQAPPRPASPTPACLAHIFSPALLRPLRGERSADPALQVHPWRESRPLLPVRQWAPTIQEYCRQEAVPKQPANAGDRDTGAANRRAGRRAARLQRDWVCEVGKRSAGKTVQN